MLFNVELDTVQKDYIMYLFGEAYVTSQKSGERPEHGAVEWTKALASLSAETKHLLKHWTYCNFTYLIKIVNVDVAIVII